MKPIELYNAINNQRLANKGKWWTFNQDGIQIKAYGTWLQLFYIKDSPINYSNVMDQSVTEFKNHILKALEEK